MSASLILLVVYICLYILHICWNLTLDYYLRVFDIPTRAPRYRARDVIKGMARDIRVVGIRSGLGFARFYHKSRELHFPSKLIDSSGVMAIAVAAHEAGHAQQTKESHIWMWFNEIILYLDNVVGHVFLGLIVARFVLFEVDLIYLFLATLLALPWICNLWIEADASRRGFSFLKKEKAIDEREIKKVKLIFWHAFLTYVTSRLPGFALGGFMGLIVFS